MAHQHNHGHSHGATTFGRAFAIGIALNLTFVVIEFTYGKWSNSLALISDAGHNLSDVLGLALAWGASVLAQTKPTRNRTYGMRRSSIFAALINAIAILVVVGAVAWEALQRFSNPQPIAGNTVIIVAAIGIFINAFSAWLFVSGSKNDLNIRGAFWHLITDAIVSLGVVITGILVVLTNWWILDPIVSLVISAVIVWGTWGLLRDSLNLALDAVPEGIEIEKVQNYLQSLPNCTDVHDLHIWAMSTTETALTAHLVIPQTINDDAFLTKVTNELHNRFGIEHATLQIENGSIEVNCHCRLVGV